MGVYSFDFLKAQKMNIAQGYTAGKWHRSDPNPIRADILTILALLPTSEVII